MVGRERGEGERGKRLGRREGWQWEEEIEEVGRGKRGGDRRGERDGSGRKR